MKKVLAVIGSLLIVVALVYLLGPRPDFEKLDREINSISLTGSELDQWILEKESQVENLKQDNQARIVWADSAKARTPYSVVYLHGYSASQGEGFPIHRDFAERYGCNLYLSRLYGHGINDKEALTDITPAKLIETAKEAIAIGKQIGEKVILMSTSTGGTLSLYLAGDNPDVAGLILYSPNIRLKDDKAPLMSGPWGLQMTEQIFGSEYTGFGYTGEMDSLYWFKNYHIKALINLQVLIDQTMNKSDFKMVTCPVFLGYYFRDEENQDPVVSVAAMLEMYEQLGTDPEMKRSLAFPETDDHVIASEYKSMDVESVKEETNRFAEEILGLKTLNN